MTELLNFIIVFVTSLIALTVLGLAAGFSPTLYIAQVATTSKSKKSNTYPIAIMSGVLIAVLLLTVLFQIIHLDTLLTIIDTTVRAVLVSVIFNMIVGAALIIAGFSYLNHRILPKPKKLTPKQAGGVAGIFWLGFVRTFMSISGVTATFIAGNVIADVSFGIFERILYTLIFLAATIVPFALIVVTMRRNPERIDILTNNTRNWLTRFNYRPVVGGAAIIFGTSIIIFNLMMALFY